MVLLVLLVAGTLLWLLANTLLKSVFFTNRFYLSGGIVAFVFLLSFFIPVLWPVSLAIFGLFTAFLIIDILLLFGFGKAPLVTRHIAERMSNGDMNTVNLSVQNNYPFTARLQIIEGLPYQFQERNHSFIQNFSRAQQQVFNYKLRPVERGEYAFDQVIIYASTLLGLARKQFQAGEKTIILVYPSFVEMRKYELMASYAQTHETGSKRMRKIGHSLEFEQIKEYVSGDDIRNINWKATARKGAIMVNNYTEQRSQQIYCLIDKGRLMKMPFNQLSLLDYAINASLMLCNVSLYRQDRFGLLSFSNKMGSFLPADRNRKQLEEVLKSLYNQQTGFLESDFEMLYMRTRALIKQRSLLLLFTNFESLTGLQRQLPYLKQIAKYHLLVVVFFENTEFKKITNERAKDIGEIYVHTVAEKFMHEKKIIVKELQKNGIMSILTPPENVTVNTLNKYLELKAREAI